MPRLPADKLAKQRKPQGRDGIWTCVRALKGDFTVNDIVDQTGIPVATVRDYLKALAAAQILEIVSTKRNNPNSAYIFRLIKNPGSETPRIRDDGTNVTQGLGVEAMWRTIKVLSSFTAEELALTASTDGTAIKKNTAMDYLKHMMRAGYVRRHAGRYSFVKSKDPGPLAPQIQRVKQVFDPNSKKVVWPKHGDA